MKRFCLTLFIVMAYVIGHSKNTSTADSIKFDVKSKNYKGFILKSKSNLKIMDSLWLMKYNFISIWEPKNKQIIKFENELCVNKNFIRTLDFAKSKHSFYYKNDTLNAEQYIRQYIGVKDKEGRKFILVSLNYWNPSIEGYNFKISELRINFRRVVEEISHYILVIYNLKTKEISIL